MKQPGADRAWPFAEGGGGTITLVTALWAGLGLLWRRWPGFWRGMLFAPATALWLLVLSFFRDPNRQPPQGPGLVLSAADGEVVTIAEEFEEHYLHARRIRISVFLSLFDVHVQRMPLGGRIKAKIHRPGRFLQAFRPEASEVNEHIAMIIETRYGDVLVKQIAGILARRCVNYAPLGSHLEGGQRFGLIRFGSRVDLYLPLPAQLLVSVGDRVHAGISPVAQFPPGEVAHE